jgi:hypothetical protein
MSEIMQFINKLYGPDVSGPQTVDLLYQKYGVKFSMTMYCLKAQLNGKMYSVMTQGSISKVMADTHPQPVLNSIRHQITQFLNGLMNLVNHQPEEQPVQANPEVQVEVPLESTEALVKAVIAEQVFPVKKKLSELQDNQKLNEPQPKPGVIALKDAEALGQKVKGTSGGSVYRTFAVNDRIKLAFRMDHSALSLRAEWKSPTIEEMAALQAVGFSVKGTYASLHMDLQNVPVAKVIGAFMFGMDVKFDRQVVSASDVKELM